MSGKLKPVEEVRRLIREEFRGTMCALDNHLNESRTAATNVDAMIEADRKAAQREACAPLEQELERLKAEVASRLPRFAAALCVCGHYAWDHCRTTEDCNCGCTAFKDALHTERENRAPLVEAAERFMRACDGSPGAAETIAAYVSLEAAIAQAKERGWA